MMQAELVLPCKVILALHVQVHVQCICICNPSPSPSLIIVAKNNIYMYVMRLCGTTVCYYMYMYMPEAAAEILEPV